MNRIRRASSVIEPSHVIEGAGVLLRRSFGPHVSNLYDPFLLLDHFAFNDPIEGPIRGFPMHPHRGIETVTYMLAGSVHHRDSLGNAGLIGPGDVQWMTSGRGILHEEMPRRSPEGVVNGFQLWVNLPASRKMGRPHYQEVKQADIPVVQTDGASIRIVAGEYDGVTGPVSGIAAQPSYMDVTLRPGARCELTVPEDHTVLAYLFEGECEFGDRVAGEAILPSVRLTVLADGDQIRAQATAASHARFLLISGAPFREPIAPYGPFVMNTAQEIQQAMADLRNGTFVQAEPA
jgi:redox-sensitive bicupin YhaK (pirin superfamily)